MEYEQNPPMQQLVTVVQELSLARDLDTVMSIVRKAARELTCADGASFVLRKGDNCFYADEDAVSPLWKGQEFPMASCISGWVMTNKKPVVIDDIFGDERIPVAAYEPTFVKSLAMVPIRTINPIGAIGNYWATPYRASFDEVTILQSLADITAVTLENINVYAELEERVRQRTVELENSNRELETFSHAVSHDLRGPLRVMDGLLNILLEKNLDKFDDQDKWITEKLIRKIREMDQLTNSLLNLFGTQKKELVKTTIGMEKMVREIFESLKTEGVKKSISFIIKDLPETNADEALIRQVWYNLISNAVKYSKENSLISIEIGADTKEGITAYYVKDNGIGFDMKYHDKLFNVFQRLHSREKFEGSGIGLAIVDHIITKHGGRIWANSSENEGATFSFTTGTD